MQIVDKKSGLETAVFGGGCFWCTETVFTALKGVQSVIPGYAGGAKPNPTYKDVCGGHTGHAEVVKIEFDANIIKFQDLLEIFFATHDPTTINRQGGDVGAQYRSIIFYTSVEQRQQAENIIKDLNASGNFDGAIVTEVMPLVKFYEAEQYHHDYFKKNPDQAYCQAIINPKLRKFKEKYSKFLK